MLQIEEESSRIYLAHYHIPLSNIDLLEHKE